MSILKVGDTDIYEVLITRSFEQLSIILKNILNAKKVLIITDENVNKIFADEIARNLNNNNIYNYKYIIKAGEKSKSLRTIGAIYSKCLELRLDRHSVIIALGGGVVGDIAGFVASTFLRGIKLIQVPTSLLAQVDSSIGGKTGVDYKGFKNIIGTFYNPNYVYINISALETLDMRQYMSAMGEIIKYSIIQDKDLFELLNSNVHKIIFKDKNILKEIIYKCCKIKSEIVTIDAFDKNIRNILNFGHTIGHAIESASKFKILHGECIAIGMLLAAKLSNTIEKLSIEEYNKIEKLINKYIIINKIEIPSKDEIIFNLSRDKKIINNKISFILPTEIGKVEICNDIKTDQIRDVLNILF